MKRLIITAALAMALSSGQAQAQAETPNPAPSMQELLDRAPEAKGIFAPQGEAAFRHIASGLNCPLTFPAVNLWHLDIYAPDGSDVGCDYGRNGRDNRWTTKLTIYAVKTTADDTADAAFARYQSEIQHKYPDARLLGPVPSVQINDARTAQYEIVINGQKSLSELVVAVRAGWVIEIRTSMAADISSDADGVKSEHDRALSFSALIQALSSMGTKQ